MISDDDRGQMMDRQHDRARRARWGLLARGRRVVVATLTAAWVAAGLAGCTAAPPTPDETAAALAAGLTSGDLTVVPLSGATPAVAAEQLTAARAGMGEARPVVTVGEITPGEDEDSAVVRLDHSWQLTTDAPDGPVWTYSTQARLSLVEDQWVAAWTSFLIAPDLRETETLSIRRDAPATRAEVLGAGGAEVLVMPRQVLRLGLDKTHVDAAGQPASAAEIATVLGLDPAEFAARVAAAGDKAFVEALVVRAENPGVDLDAFGAVVGANVVADTLPLAPSRRFAREVLGTAGPATAEIIEASGGRVVAGDTVGLSGLQRQYDAQLAGSPGMSVLATASDNGQERVLFTQPPVDGTPLVTTLVSAMQEAADATLAPVGPPSALVAIRPSTGAVVAAASGPGSAGYSTATLGTYPPGSVFKTVSTLAALRSGLTPDSVVECPDGITVDGRTFGNVPGYPAAALGAVPLRTAFAHSCNSAFIGLRDQAPPEALAAAAASLGLGGEADLGYPAFLGAVPTDSTGTDHAASMIGQGRVQASPLAMATVAASIAAGRTVTPWLVGERAPEAAGAEPLTPAEAEALRALMRAVVTEGGATDLLGVPGEPVLAKTGTAQYSADGATRNHTWMIAVQGDLAVAVFVEDGESGARTSGPLLATFLELAPE